MPAAAAPDTGPNIDGTVDAGFSLIDNTAGATINATTPGSNVTGLNPQLGPLADNGGPTATMALTETSPALDAGDGTGAKHDQRGDRRPIELPGIANSSAPGADGSDIGAFELQGIEAAKCRGKQATIIAVPGVPTTGTKGNDVIAGTDGPDDIRGFGGRDLICGWNGDDFLLGGGGNDTVVGQSGKDTVKGEGGRDRLGGGAGQDKLVGGAGRDGLIGGRAADTLIGGGGLDRLFGKTGADRMFGNGGPDRLFGGPGKDRFAGGPGRNVLHLVRGDGDKVVGRNSKDVVIVSGRAKRKQP